MTNQIPIKDAKLLWGLAAARCSHPECDAVLVERGTATDEAATAGEMAHIVPRSLAPDEPRQDPDFPVEKRNKYENLILLCYKHHRPIVDRQPNAHPAVLLHSWKRQHEDKVNRSLSKAVTQLDFPALEMIVAAFRVGQPPPTESITLIPIGAKMQRNDMSIQLTGRLVMASGGAAVVESFVADATLRTDGLADQLKAGFRAKYESLRSLGVEGDSLFMDLHKFAAQGSADFGRQAAALAVLGYLFTTCEVFES